MQTFPELSNLVWTVAKILVVFGLSLYVIFALVVVRQVQLMTKTIHMNFEIPVKFLVLVHLFFAIGVLIFALIIL